MDSFCAAIIGAIIGGSFAVAAAYLAQRQNFKNLKELAFHKDNEYIKAKVRAKLIDLQDILEKRSPSNPSLTINAGDLDRLAKAIDPSKFQEFCNACNKILDWNGEKDKEIQVATNDETLVKKYRIKCIKEILEYTN